MNLRIAILTRPDFRSPRILAESLKHQLQKAGSQAEILYEIDVLTRLFNYSESSKSIKFHFWLRRKILNYFNDRKIIKRLKHFDAVVISECCPNAFWKKFYNVEKFKKITGLPVLFYEVYFLGNAPTQVTKLQQGNEPLVERYDWHLAVSEVTETRGTPGKGWSCIGLDLSYTTLKPARKKDFVALVDFAQKGYEKYRQEQIEAFAELGIRTIVLHKTYTVAEIRALYKLACVYLIQSPEAYGLPISECLACGAQIFTPNSAWPMSWRLNENPEVHSEGILPEVFTVYESKEDLKRKIIELKNDYDLSKTPFRIFNTFIRYYPQYYYGNTTELKAVLKRIEQRRFN